MQAGVRHREGLTGPTWSQRTGAPPARAGVDSGAVTPTSAAAQVRCTRRRALCCGAQACPRPATAPQRGLPLGLYGWRSAAQTGAERGAQTGWLPSAGAGDLQERPFGRQAGQSRPADVLCRVRPPLSSCSWLAARRQASSDQGAQRSTQGQLAPWRKDPRPARGLPGGQCPQLRPQHEAGPRRNRLRRSHSLLPLPEQPAEPGKQGAARSRAGAPAPRAGLDRADRALPPQYALGTSQYGFTFPLLLTSSHMAFSGELPGLQPKAGCLQCPCEPCPHTKVACCSRLPAAAHVQQGLPGQAQGDPAEAVEGHRGDRHLHGREHSAEQHQPGTRTSGASWWQPSAASNTPCRRACVLFIQAPSACAAPCSDRVRVRCAGVDDAHAEPDHPRVHTCVHVPAGHLHRGKGSWQWRGSLAGHPHSRRDPPACMQHGAAR